MSIVAIRGKIYKADHSKLLLLNSFWNYLSEDDFLLFFSDNMECNSLGVNLSTNKHLPDLIAWQSRISRSLLTLLSCFSFSFNDYGIASFNWIYRNYISSVKLNSVFRLSQSLKMPKWKSSSKKDNILFQNGLFSIFMYCLRYKLPFMKAFITSTFYSWTLKT